MLPRLRAIVARGELTHRHLIDFSLSNVEEGSDFAFLMGTRDDDQASAKEVIATLG